MIRIDAVWLASEPMDMRGGVDTILARVLDAAGIQTVVAIRAGCRDAVKFHLNDQECGKAEMGRNIDALWPYVEQGVEVLVMNASGGGVTVKEYGYTLNDDAAYAEKAARIRALTCDLSELLPELVESLRGQARRPPRGGSAAHEVASVGATFDMGGGFVPYRRDVRYSTAHEAPYCRCAMNSSL